jgi:hypothetical protein
MARFDVDAALANAGTDGPQKFKMPSAPAAPERYRGGYQPRSDEVQGFMSAMQGPTLGFLDEAVGGLSALGKITQGADAMAQQYRDARDAVRANVEDYEKNYKSAGLTRMATAMPVYMAAPVMKLASLPVNLGTNILRVLPSALAIGGLTAAGESESDTASGVAEDAAKGAAVSGATTMLTMPLAAAVGAGYRGMQRVAGGSSPAGSAARAEIERAAREKLAKNITRDAKPGTVFSGAPVPTGEVNAAGLPIMRSAVSLATEQAAKQVGKLGERGMILDLPGGNVRQLADTLTILPGQTKNKVVAEQLARRATSADRLINSADEAIASLNAAGRRAVREGRVPPTPAVNPSIEAFKASRRAAAAPLYRQLEALEVTVDAPLAAAIQAMRRLGALKEAEDMAIADRRIFTLAGDVQEGARVSASDLDLAKRGLDQLIHNETDKVTGAVSPKGTRLLNLLDDFKNYFDDLTVDPATGQSLSKAARSAWAGDTALIQATELGRRALDADKGGKIATEIAKLGDSEVQAFRIGVLDAIKQKAGSKAGRTQLLSFWENPNVSDKLKAAFGGNFKQFAAALMREERLKGIQKIGQGSQTAGRLNAVDDLGQALDDVASVASTVKTGSPLGFMGALKTLYQKTAMPEPVRDELGRIMTLKGPEAQQELLSLADLVREMQAKQMISAGRIGAATGAAGRAVPGSNNQQQ